MLKEDERIIWKGAMSKPIFENALIISLMIINIPIAFIPLLIFYLLGYSNWIIISIFIVMVIDFFSIKLVLSFYNEDYKNPSTYFITTERILKKNWNHENELYPNIYESNSLNEPIGTIWMFTKDIKKIEIIKKLKNYHVYFYVKIKNELLLWISFNNISKKENIKEILRKKLILEKEKKNYLLLEIYYL